MSVRAVVFDLYETLISEFADGTRIAPSSGRGGQPLGIDDATFNREWNARQHGRMTGRWPDYPSVMRDILQSLQLPVSEPMIQEMYETRIADKSYPFRAIRPDIIALLRELRSRNLKLGLISNCTEEEVRLWSECPLAEWFDCVFFSYETGVAKPDEAIYRMACDELCIPPQDAVFVGDGGSDELNGAARAGLHPLHAFWYNTYIASNYPKLHRPAQVLDFV
ncbi:MAG: HAD-IA family hydrolase [Paenibacillaceae bacterium]|nr:HAD-IA family hydrolase [Paenibacillaceae bacterium]